MGRERFRGFGLLDFVVRRLFTGDGDGFVNIDGHGGFSVSELGERGQPAG